jgi:serine phosphatase RsbU (regulator of sigma subunit)
MDYLTIIAPDGVQRRHDLGPTGARIGRASANDVVLQDLNVSRVHAEVVRRSDGCYVSDTGGKNGTFVNDRRIEAPALLRPGDRIRVGTTVLVFDGSSSTAVEFSDAAPLPGAGTTYLAPEGVLTPALSQISLLMGAEAVARRGATGISAPSTTPPAADRALAASAAALKIIYEADQELVFHRPLDDIFNTIMDLAHKAVPFERGLLMVLEGGKLEPRVVRVPSGEAGTPISISRTIADRVIGKQESVLSSDALLDERFRAGVSIEIQHIRSLMCVPLWNNREVIGLLYVDSRQAAGLFNEDNLRVLTHLANVAGVKIESARLFEQVRAAALIEQELQRAAEIQNFLLPSKSPSIPGFAIFGNSVACHSVGGDYFDYIELPRGRCAIGLGDVAGKGFPAALLMCSFQASLRALSELDLPPEETIGKLNRLLSRAIPDNRFVTFFYGVLDPLRSVMTYVNAGQNQPWLIPPVAEPRRLELTGPPLGLFADSGYSTGTLTFEPNDILVCFSDGVTEAASPSDEEFGEDRLKAVVRQARAGSPPEIAGKITQALDRHCLGSTRQDDVTLVVLKRDPA